MAVKGMGKVGDSRVQETGLVVETSTSLALFVFLFFCFVQSVCSLLLSLFFFPAICVFFGHSMMGALVIDERREQRT